MYYDSEIRCSAPTLTNAWQSCEWRVWIPVSIYSQKFSVADGKNDGETKGHCMADRYIATRIGLLVILKVSKADPGGRGHVPPPPLASLIIYLFLNNFVIFTTLVHLREALSYYRPTFKTVIQEPADLSAYHCIWSRF